MQFLPILLGEDPNVWLELFIDSILLTLLITVILSFSVYRLSKDPVNLPSVVTLFLIRGGLIVFGFESMIMLWLDLEAMEKFSVYSRY